MSGESELPFDPTTTTTTGGEGAVGGDSAGDTNLLPPLQPPQQPDIQYCPKVLDSKCANFVLCSRDLSLKVRSKVREKFRGI